MLFTRYPFFASLIVSILISSAAGQKVTRNESSEDEKEIRKLIQTLDQAFVGRDFDTLSRVLSDKYTLLGIPRKQFIEALKNHQTRYEYMHRDQIQVRVYDDIAVTSGLVSQRSSSMGVLPYDSEFSFADVWARLEGRWQCVSSWIGSAEDFKSSQGAAIRIGPELKASLLVFFKAAVTEEQIQRLQSDLFFVLRLNARLFKDENVCHYLRVYPALQDHERMALTFCEKCSTQERADIKSALQSSPIVYRVMENVAPVDVRKLD